MNKTFSITNTEVLNHLECLKFEGIKTSQYVTDLILKDIHKEENSLSKDDLIKMILAITSQNQKFQSNENQTNITYDTQEDSDRIFKVLNDD